MDAQGAEKLLGKGDMLFLPMGESIPQRIQGAFVSDGEVEKVVDFVKSNGVATYNEDILSRFNYTVKLAPWLNEGISQLALDNALIGFYPGGDQITIPHYDADGRFVGLRGRTMCKDEGERFGKYRPLRINDVQYNHPLGMNLYGLNWAKNQIPIVKKAVVFESEKSVLKKSNV